MKIHRAVGLIGFYLYDKSFEKKAVVMKGKKQTFSDFSPSKDAETLYHMKNFVDI